MRAIGHTAKAKVLSIHPKAYCRYVGLSLKFVIVADHRGPELSRHRLRERDAWADAAKERTGETNGRT